jgi:hypothetical protein
MKNLPTKDYRPLFSINQLCLPMDVGVLIPKDDSVRLLVYVLKQLDLTPLYEAYTAYGERRGREEAAREREAAERDTRELVTADETEAEDTHPGRGAEKKKDGRPACDILTLLAVTLYGWRTPNHINNLFTPTAT